MNTTHVSSSPSKGPTHNNGSPFGGAGGFPFGNGSSRTPTLRDFEGLLTLSSLFVYWKNVRDHRLSVQRSIIVATRPKKEIVEELERVTSIFQEQSAEVYSSEREYHFDLMSIPERAELDPSSPHDSVLYSVSSRLAAAKKSSTTGEIYPDITKKYCPHSKSKLKFFVSTQESQ